MPTPFALPQFTICEDLSSSMHGYRHVYKVQSEVNQRFFKCYHFELDSVVSYSALRTLFAFTYGDYIAIKRLPDVTVFPTAVGMDATDQEKAELDLMALLHALTILRHNVSLQSYVHQFDDSWCLVQPSGVYLLFPWLSGIPLHEVRGVEGQSMQVRSVNAVLNLLSDFHQAGVCIHDVSMQNLREGRLYQGNIWFVESNGNLACRLIDIESIMYFGSEDARQKAAYIHTPCFSAGYISDWIITPVDSVYALFEAYKRGDVVYGWHVDVILSLAILQESGCLEFEQYTKWISSLQCQGHRPGVSPPFTPRLGEAESSRISISIDPTEAMHPSVSKEVQSDSRPVDKPARRAPKQLMPLFVLFVVLGFAATAWFNLAEKPAWPSLTLPKMGVWDTTSNLDTLYASSKETEWETSYLTTLQELQQRHAAEPKDTDVYAEILFLKAISPNVDECGVWFDAAKGRKFNTEYIIKAYQRPVCQRLYQEVQELADKNTRNRVVQRTLAFWKATECIATKTEQANVSTACDEANTLTLDLLRRSNRLPLWSFWELTRLYLTLNEVIENETDLDAKLQVCEQVFVNYQRPASALLSRRVLQSTKRCWEYGYPERQFTWMNQVVTRANFSALGWFYQLSTGQCAGTTYQPAPSKWRADSVSDYCSWLSTSLGDEQVYPLPEGLVVSKWCALDLFDVMGDLGISSCTPVPDLYNWHDSVEHLQAFLPQE